LAAIVKEQAAATESVPCPLCAICNSNDLVVVDAELPQPLAMAAIAGAKAVGLTLGIVGEHKCQDLMNMAHSNSTNSTIGIATREEACTAIHGDGGRIITANKNNNNALFSTQEGKMMMINNDLRENSSLQDCVDML
jgi:hypothetical protein